MSVGFLTRLWYSASPQSMSQKEIEVILIRQLASYLAMAVFIVDAESNLVFYNEPAERPLGLRFDETGEMPATGWATAWTPNDEQGTPVAPEALPLWSGRVAR